MTAQSDRIKKLLDDGDLQEAVVRVETAIFKGWADTPPTNHEMKEEWHRRLFSLSSIFENLKAAIQDAEYQDYIEAEKGKPAILGDIAAWRMKNR